MLSVHFGRSLQRAVRCKASVPLARGGSPLNFVRVANRCASTPLYGRLVIRSHTGHSHGGAYSAVGKEDKHDDEQSGSSESIWASLRAMLPGGGHGGPGGGHGHSHGAPQRLTAADKAALQGPARNITLFGGAMNLGLAAAKFVLGILIKSNALVADAVHSLSDMVSDVVTIFALRWSNRPRTKAFPFGFGKVENMSAVIVSVLLVIAGGGMLWQSIGALLVAMGWMKPEDAGFFGHGHSHGAPDTSDAHEEGGPSAKTLTRIAVALALASVAAKEFLYAYTKKLAIRMNSPALMANASHHRSDSLSAMVTLVGVAGNWAGVPVLDPIAGAIVSGMIVKMGIEVGWDNARQLLDASVPTSLLKEIHRVLQDTVGLRPTSDANGGYDPLLSRFRYHSLRARSAGQYVTVDMVLSSYDADHPPTLAEADEVQQLVRKRLKTAFPQVREVIIQIDDHAPMLMVR